MVMVNVSHGPVVQRRHACFDDLNSTGGCLKSIVLVNSSIIADS